MEPKPFLKWAGDKTQLLPEILKHIPDFETYYEPFVGAGALFFELQPKQAFVSDSNQELINCYKMLAESPDKVAAVIDMFPVNEEFFYALRVADRENNYFQSPDVWKAARILYLNKTCFNGLYRVNSRGEFNAPWGKYKNPKIYDLDNLHAVSNYLLGNNVKVNCCDFEFIFTSLGEGDFIYCDPPYDTVSETSDFTGYTAGGFLRTQQVRLKQCVDKATEAGAKVLLSNADTEFINELWKDYTIVVVDAKRNINSKGDKRGKVQEVLIKNY